MHGYTYSGHAAACAVGLKNIEIIEAEGLVERAANMGQRLLNGLESLKEFPFVDNVRGRGLLCGLEIVTDRDSRVQDNARAEIILNTCLVNGLRTRAVGGNTLAFSPPLIITEEEVDTIVEILGNVMADIA
jgi:adenosylmethionine-8-amino-7-oxononanoate aminotransferase